MGPLVDIDVVLVRPQGAVNVGAAARVVANYGARRLVLVAPRADTGGREARMFADRAQETLAAARVCASLAEALAGVELAVGTSSKIRAARDGAALTPRLARALRPAPSAQGIALVFGNEAEGLTRDEAAQCHRVVRLAAPGPYESLNLSHAVAVALAAFLFADEDEGPARAPASTQTRRRLEQGWLRALQGAGFFGRTTPAAFAPRLQALVDRLALDEDDARLLHDMLAVLGDRDREAGAA